MWRLKQFMPKDQAGLEGKTVEVGSLKLQVRSTIAQGGFSCVYLARDAQSTKQYALKHIICNDTESLDLVKKEVAVMKTLRDHPNVVTMHAQAVYDMGRTKECFLVMEYCEKMLVNVLDSRGAGYFEEKQLLLMFRDICNAVYAMHCQHPPIAHRDLKAENVLLGGDGLWKLCDFGSTSTNHKRFEKPDEMGVEEDIIRKHTTPAYRAPEMWDLYRRELISEKVDIWALGCLLYRMAYFKSAFDGESKLQILNGNYRIPDVPKYTVIISNLIKDMLNASPEARPDVMQVWRRVNDSLPTEYRKAGPDKPPGTAMPHEMPDTRHAAPNRLSPIMPSRAPPPPPHLRDVGGRSPPVVPKEAERRSPPLFPKEGEHRSPPLPLKDADRRPSHGGGNNAPSGAFWSTQYAQEAQYDDDTAFSLDKAGDHGPSIHVVKSSDVPARQVGVSPPIEHQSIAGQFFKKSGVTNLMKRVHGNIHHAGARARDDVDTDGYEMRIDDEDLEKEEKVLNRPTEASLKITSNEAAGAGHSTDEAFSAFVAEFQNSMNFTVEHSNSGKESLQLEVERLREELKQVRAEKADIASKYEKLTAICRSQRQEIHELKSAMAAVNSEIAVPGGKDTVSQTWLGSSQSSQVPQQQRQQSPKRSLEAVQQQQEKQLGSIWDLQEGLSVNNSKRSSTSETQAWQAFGDTTGLQLSPQQSAYFMKSSGMNDAVDSPRFDSPKAGSINGQRRQHHARAISFAGDTWGFVQDSFTSLGSPFQASRSSGQVSSQSEPSIGNTTVRDSSNSTGENRPLRSADRSQPAGWAGF